MTKKEFESVFKNIDEALRGDAGCSTVLDYIEQTSWVLFLKYLNDYESDRKSVAVLDGKSYSPIITDDFTWEKWAVPKKKDGTLDRNAVRTGEDLVKFVNEELFPYLEGFRQKAKNQYTIHYKIGVIFSELRNKIQSGYALRDVVDKVNELTFLSNEDKHELSSLYEDKIKNMGNAGRNSGEYYTPRPLIKSIVKIIDPKIGEKVYDGAVGSAGFLCEAYTHMRNCKTLSNEEYETLQNKTFFGKEKKSLAYVIGIMNMILHGIEAPNIIHTNTLVENLAEIQESNKVDVILANPPFGGEERAEIQQNFPLRTSETAYLFLQHFMKMLKAGGRCGVVIKNTFLSNTDNASKDLRKQLLESCNLFAVLDLPSGVFSKVSVKTVVLFFEKGKSTDKIWYYQLNLERSLGKTSPLNEDDLAEFESMFARRQLSENSWIVHHADICQDTWDLTVHNPKRPDDNDNRSPKQIIAEIEGLQVRVNDALKIIKEELDAIHQGDAVMWKKVKLGDIATVSSGNSAPQDKRMFENGIFPFVRTSDVGKIQVGQITSSSDLLNEAGTKKMRLFQKGTILFPKSGASTFLNHRVILGKDAYISSHLATIKAETRIALDRYLFYFLQTINAKDLVAHSGYPSLKISTISDIIIQLPPLEEQRRIVAKLDNILEQCHILKDITSKQIEQYQVLKSAFLTQELPSEVS